jgi:hypothetical protein
LHVTFVCDITSSCYTPQNGRILRREPVDNVVECAARMEKAGATRLTPLDATGRHGQAGRGQRPSNAEVKLSGPDGVIIDFSEFGWLGNSL